MRSTRNTRTVVEPDSDDLEDADEDAEGEEDEEMGGGEAAVDRELLAQDDDEDGDAEGEDDESMLQETHPPPPVIRQTTSKAGRPNVTVTAPNEGTLKSVEAKEMDDLSDSDNSLSELDDADLEDETGGLGPDDDLMDGEEDADGEELSDLDSASRSATPDLSKLTSRQKGKYIGGEGCVGGDGGGLLALSNEATKKKQLTVEEHAMRRQEMARRRKALSEKKIDDEKVRLPDLFSARGRLPVLAWPYANCPSQSRTKPSRSSSRSPHRSAAPARR